MKIKNLLLNTSTLKVGLPDITLHKRNSTLGVISDSFTNQHCALIDSNTGGLIFGHLPAEVKIFLRKWVRDNQQVIKKTMESL